MADTSFKASAALTLSDWFRRPSIYEALLTWSASLAAFATAFRYYPFGGPPKPWNETLSFWGIVTTCVITIILGWLKFTTLSHEVIGLHRGWKMANEAGLIFTIDALVRVGLPDSQDPELCGCVYKPVQHKGQTVLEQVTDYVGHKYHGRVEDDCFGQRIPFSVGVVGAAFRNPQSPVLVTNSVTTPSSEWHRVLTQNYSMPPDVLRRVNPSARSFLALAIQDGDNPADNPCAVLYFESSDENYFSQSAVDTVAICATSFASSLART